MADAKLILADEFSRYPAGRTRRDGENSAERFREDILVPALRRAIASGSRLVVTLDGAYGYSSSFLEETFGGLVRRGAFAPEQIESHLVIESQSPIYATAKIDADHYLHDALRRVAA